MYTCEHIDYAFWLFLTDNFPRSLILFLGRRTVKDLFTFIPVIIIWIIPLTPVGHVLVFGAIQRFFPDFFPSCFTEQRQNLLQLYESTEFSEFTIKETPQVGTFSYDYFLPYYTFASDGYALIIVTSPLKNTLSLKP